MDRIIGGVLGLAAFTAVLLLGLEKGMSFTGSVGRAVVALILGYLVGRLIFGMPGLSIVREAAGQVPPTPPAPGDSERSESAPKQAPPPGKAS
jgi:hypothetical protein